MGFLIIVALCFGLLTKKSFKKSSTNLEFYNDAQVSLSDSIEGYFDNDIEGYDELFEKSDLIVVGKVAGKRETYNQAFKTKFKVNKIIKDDSAAQLPKSIYVFEPSYFYFDSYDVASGYNIMLDNTDYILFLKHLDVPDGYTYKNDESITFLPVSSYYGKYTLNDNRNEEVIHPNEDLTYKDVKSMGVLTEEKDIIDTYNTIKSQINNEMNHHSISWDSVAFSLTVGHILPFLFPVLHGQL